MINILRYITVLSILFVCLVFPACDERDHADYGTVDPPTGGSSPGGDSDGGTDTGDTSPCATGEIYQSSAGRCWRRCPVGQTWSGSSCSGSVTFHESSEASAACKALATKYSAASRAAFLSILDNCESGISSGSEGSCDSCSDSTVCDDFFGNDTRTYWTSSIGWSVDLGSGEFESTSTLTASNAVRCVW